MSPFLIYINRLIGIGSGQGTMLQGHMFHCVNSGLICDIQKGWKQLRCPNMGELIQKMWFIYTMEYYSAIKNEEILSFSGKWMELENIIPSEVTQTHRTFIAHTHI